MTKTRKPGRPETDENNINWPQGGTVNIGPRMRLNPDGEEVVVFSTQGGSPCVVRATATGQVTGVDDKRNLAQFLHGLGWQPGTAVKINVSRTYTQHQRKTVLHFDVKNATPGKTPGTTPDLVHLANLLRQFKCVILEGVPGTGKTHAWSQLLQPGALQRERSLRGAGAVTFHPASSYEDFVEGLRPNATWLDTAASNVDKSKFESSLFFTDALPAPASGSWGIENGTFLRACRQAIDAPEEDHLLLIDEINRANVPKVLGDLLTLLEPSKRTPFTGCAWTPREKHLITLPLSKRKLFVPENLYVLATMNTTDRSVTPLDQALRRRFAFLRVEPMAHDKLEEQLKARAPHSDWPKEANNYKVLNAALEELLGADGKVGHSYFLDAAAAVASGTIDFVDVLRNTWQCAVLPQVFETLRANNRVDLLKDLDKAAVDSGQEAKSGLRQALRDIETQAGINIKFDGNGLNESITVTRTKGP